LSSYTAKEPFAVDQRQFLNRFSLQIQPSTRPTRL